MSIWSKAESIRLRDRALIGLMVYRFARIGAALGMKVRDVYTQNPRLWVRLHEKGVAPRMVARVETTWAKFPHVPRRGCPSLTREYGWKAVVDPACGPRFLEGADPFVSNRASQQE